jgi:hypothetical protein
VNRVWAGVAALAAALACAGTAAAADVGVNDDSAKYGRDAAWFFSTARSVGLKQVVISVRFLPRDPATIQDRRYVDRAVAEAAHQGVRVVFAVYPYPPAELQKLGVDPHAFGLYVTKLARTYPTVRQFVIGNEPNQPAFFRPQFRHERNFSAARTGAMLAWAYDALKLVDPAIAVVGVGLSPRGNDDPAAKSNRSTSPVRFIQALGRWYRATGRERPIMDGFGFHPYPNRHVDPIDRGYPWPNAGFANLDRVKQALWDAFHGTSQPTTVEGLDLYLDEVGWQVDTRGRRGYTGKENVPVTTEALQAGLYAEVVRRAACDPDIAQVNFFGLDDDAERNTGWQAALHWADGTPKLAVQAIRDAMWEAEQRGCAGTPPAWSPVAGVAGAWAGKPERTRTGELRVSISAQEGATATACVLYASAGAAPETLERAMQTRRARAVGCVTRTIAKPQRRLRITLPRVAGTGRAHVGVRFAAEANAGRRSVLVVPLKRA